MPSITASLGLVAGHHFVEVGILVAHVLDLLPGEVAGAVGDREASLRGAVNKVVPSIIRIELLMSNKFSTR